MTGKKKLFSLLAVCLAFGLLSEGQGSKAFAEKVRTAIPQANLNYLSVYVAEARGYFKDEGIDHETVVIAGPNSTAALLSGEIDYSGSGGSGMRAATKGAPIKAILFQTERVTFYLVTEPGITKVTDLRGKKIAVGNIGDTQDTLMTMFVERGGLSAKDVIRISTGPSTASRILAIKTGAVNAGTMDPAGVILSEKEGLRTLAYLGDLFPFPFQGFVTTDRKIAENPAQVKRWLKAMVRGLMFIRERPDEAATVGVKKLQLGTITRAVLLESIQRYLQALPDGVPGLPSQEGVKNVLEYDVRVPMGIKTEIRPETIFNLRFIEEVKKELESAGATR